MLSVQSVEALWVMTILDIEAGKYVTPGEWLLYFEERPNELELRHENGASHGARRVATQGMAA